MSSATIDVTPYNGTLLALDLLSGSQTLLLSSFGPTESRELIDSDGTLSTDDNGISTLDGVPLTYIGSGTAQAGVDLAGVTVGLGPEVDVVVFEAGGQIYFHYPDGPPSETGQIAMIINITSAPYDLIAPVCFAAGTRIATPGGEVRIQDLRVGDAVIDADGAAHEVRWILRRTLRLDNQLPAARLKLAPVIIPPNAFGPGRPAHPLRVSQQHNICVDHHAVSLYFGHRRALVPARAFLSGLVKLDLRATEVTYYHVLCDDHVVLLANGLPAESLRVAEGGLAEIVARQRQDVPPPEAVLAAFSAPIAPAAPRLTVFEGRLIRAALTTGTVPRIRVPGAPRPANRPVGPHRRGPARDRPGAGEGPRRVSALPPRLHQVRLAGR